MWGGTYVFDKKDVDNLHVILYLVKVQNVYLITDFNVFDNNDLLYICRAFNIFQVYQYFTYLGR